MCSAPDLPASCWEEAVCKALQMVLVDQGPYAERLNAITIELQRRAGSRQSEMAALTRERDGVKGRMKRLIDLAEAGDAPIKGIADRLKGLEKEVKVVELKIAEMEGLSSASNVDAAGVQLLLQQLQAGAVGLESRAPEEQKLVLNSLLAEVRIGHGKPITLSLWMPDLTALSGPKQTHNANNDANIATPTAGVSCGGRGFVWSSRMVEAPGIESPRPGPTTACNNRLYYRLDSSYSGFGPSTETAVKAAFGHSMVPIPGAATAPPTATAAYQGEEGKRPRRGWRKWAPQLDELGRPVVEYGFAVTIDPLRIEQIGRVVMWLQEQGRLKRAPPLTTPA